MSKSLSEFARKHGGHNYKCKSCQNEYTKQHYLDNKEKYKAKAGNQKRKLRKLKSEYMATHGCVDCGESDPEVLDLDHVRGTKVLSVSDMVGRAVSVAAFWEEIAKCDVRCANCHRKITRKREKDNALVV